MDSNLDSKTVDGFGSEWKKYDQSKLPDEEHSLLFGNYFSIFPWHLVDEKSIGFDMGCGSGRWAKLVAPHVGTLFCVDPSDAIYVAEKNLQKQPNCIFFKRSVGDYIADDNSMDFGYSLGVLHHVPDIERGLRDCVKLLKVGAPFLLYLYYSFDNQSRFYKVLWYTSNILRLIIARLPDPLKSWTCLLIAAVVYLPLARLSLILEKVRFSQSMVNKIPLNFYRKLSFYTMKTDALDRFGTRLEKRFSKGEIFTLMKNAGLDQIKFSGKAPYWCAVGIKRF